MHRYIRYGAAVFAVSALLTGCAGSSSASGSGSAGSGNTTTDSLHFELDTGVLDYAGYEYVGKGFYHDGDGDVEKTVCLNFDYTNLENTPKAYWDDFWVNAYQNGTELDTASNYYSSDAPESVQNSSKEVLQNGTIRVGFVYVLQDESPVTVIARHNGGKETSDQMVLNIGPYEDTSFDINRIYGYYEGKNDTSLTVTSSKVTLNYSKTSSTYRENPNVWTDASNLYPDLGAVDKFRIEEQDGVIHLISEEYDFAQVENWPEDGEAVELQTVAMGETITTEFAELTFNNSGSTNELKYSSTQGNGGDGYGGNITFTTVLERESAGTTYLYLEGTLKNTSSNAYDPTNMKAKLVINGSTELEADVHAVERGSTEHEVSPMNSIMVVLHTGVDTSAVKDITSLEWHFGFDRSFSGSSGGDPETCRYYYMIKER